MEERIDSVVTGSLAYRTVAWLDERLRSWIEGSLVHRAVTGAAQAVAGAGLFRLALGLGAPPRAAQESLLARAAGGVFDWLARRLGPLADRVEHSALGRWWQGSLLSRLVTFEAGILFVLCYVPLSLWLTLHLPYWVKWAAEAALAAMLGGLLLQLATGRRRLVFTALDGPVLIWILISVVSALINGNGLVQTVAGLRAMFQYYLLAVIIANAGLSREQVRRMLAVLCGLVAVLGLVGVIQWVIKVPTPPEWVDMTERDLITTRAFGTMANPNTFGGYLVLFAAPLIALWTAPLKPWQRFGLVVALPLILGATLFTYSRSSWFALALALLIIGVVRDRRILVAGLLGAAVLPLVSPKIVARIAQGFSDTYFSKSATGGRLAWWSKALEVNDLNPLFGVGPGQFGGAAANYFGTKANALVGLSYRFPLWVDSQLFQYIAEVGYLGLIAFFWMILTFLRSAAALYRRADAQTAALVLGFAAAVVGLLVQSIFASMWEMQQITSVVWAGMALICRQERELQERIGLVESRS
jgi:O-antigen ligase